MAVKVHIGGSTTKAETYPAGMAISVTDAGHLSVLKPGSSSGRKTIAIYAPGQWRYAEVAEDEP
jgi:hypothetical protein